MGQRGCYHPPSRRTLRRPWRMLPLPRTALLTAALAAALSSSACLPVLSVPGQTTAASTTQSNTSNNAAVHIGKAVRGDLTGVLTFTAPVQTKGSVAIIPRVNATLNKLDVDVGSQVREGDTIAER